GDVGEAFHRVAPSAVAVLMFDEPATGGGDALAVGGFVDETQGDEGGGGGEGRGGELARPMPRHVALREKGVLCVGQGLAEEVGVDHRVFSQGEVPEGEEPVVGVFEVEVLVVPSAMEAAGRR